MFKLIMTLSVALTILIAMAGLIDVFKGLATVEPNVYSIVLDLNKRPKENLTVTDKVLVARRNAER